MFSTDRDGEDGAQGPRNSAGGEFASMEANSHPFIHNTQMCTYALCMYSNMHVHTRTYTHTHIYSQPPFHSTLLWLMYKFLLLSNNWKIPHQFA